MRILIKNLDEIYTADKDQQIKNGFIIINNGFIERVGLQQELDDKQADITESDNFNVVIDGKNKMALPGLINTHTHAAMTLLRGYADDLPLKNWLEDEIWPFEAKLKAEDIYWGTMLAIIEMIRTGTTTFTDMYFQMNRVAKAAERAGIRAVLAEGLIMANDGSEGLEKAAKFADDWNGCADGRISTMMGPHAPYTCSADYLREISKIAQQLSIPINIHLAETRYEFEESIKNHNLSPVKYLEQIGLFNSPVLAAHCVHLESTDLDILLKNQVGIAYNPCSNMKLGSGIAPISNMLEKGLLVCFGTDGVASNNNLDLIEEARIGSYLQKVSQANPIVLDIFTMLEMLTISGAKAVRQHKLGILKKGYLADLILIDLTRSSYYYPGHNNLSNFFYAGSGRDVNTVIINGKIIMQDNIVLTIDEDLVYAEVKRIVDEKT